MPSNARHETGWAHWFRRVLVWGDLMRKESEQNKGKKLRFAALAGSAGKRSGLTVDKFELGILVRPWSVSRLIILWA